MKTHDTKVYLVIVIQLQSKFWIVEKLKRKPQPDTPKKNAEEKKKFEGGYWIDKEGSVGIANNPHKIFSTSYRKKTYVIFPTQV